MIKLKNITKIYGGSKNQLVIDSFSYQFKDKGLYRVIGKNGSGKSTLLKIISAELNPSYGFIDYGNCQKENIQYIDFGAQIVRDITLYDNLVLTYETRNGKIDHEIIDRYLADFNLTFQANTLVSKLSKGERRRAIILLAIIKDTKVFLFDEPTASLDIDNAQMIYALLERLSRDNLVIFTANEENLFQASNAIIVDPKSSQELDESNSEITDDKSIEPRKKQKHSLGIFMVRYYKNFVLRAAIILSVFVSVLCLLTLNLNYNLNNIDSVHHFLDPSEALVYRKDFQPLDENIIKDSFANKVTLHGFEERNFTKANLDSIQDEFTILPSKDSNNHLPENVIKRDKHKLKVSTSSHFEDIELESVEYDAKRGEIYLNEFTYQYFLTAKCFENSVIKSNDRSYQVGIFFLEEIPIQKVDISFRYFSLPVYDASIESVDIIQKESAFVIRFESELYEKIRDHIFNTFSIVDFHSPSAALREAKLLAKTNDELMVLSNLNAADKTSDSIFSFFSFCLLLVALIFISDLAKDCMTNRRKSFNQELQFIGFSSQSKKKVSLLLAVMRLSIDLLLATMIGIVTYFSNSFLYFFSPISFFLLLYGIVILLDSLKFFMRKSL